MKTKKTRRRLAGGFAGFNVSVIAEILGKSPSTTRNILRAWGTYNNNTFTLRDLRRLCYAVELHETLKRTGNSKLFPSLHAVVESGLRPEDSTSIKKV